MLLDSSLQGHCSDQRVKLTTDMGTPYYVPGAVLSALISYIS
jgi:hypothetical protein